MSTSGKNLETKFEKDVQNVLIIGGDASFNSRSAKKNTIEEENYLKSFIHEVQKEIQARTPVNLATINTPDAVVLKSSLVPTSSPLPGGVGQNATDDETRSKSEQFDSVSDALSHCNGRMLLLGSDGSGKTTSLLKFALQVAQDRLDQPQKPMPMWGPIHTWKEGQGIIVWMQSLLNESKYQIDLKEGNYIYLLDGLDELTVETTDMSGKHSLEQNALRLSFINSVRKEITNSQYILTCREEDFRIIGAKVPLGGAVTLQELSESQIESFLVENRKPLCVILLRE